MTQARRTFLVMLGVPGAGKGTQARLLEEALGIPQISTGDLFRYNLKNQTELGLLAKSYMDRGELVPDEVTILMVQDRIQREDCQKGAIFDGFPRNLVQAVALDQMTAGDGGIRRVLMFNLDDDEAMRRITGRRTCPVCGTVYHVDYNPPKVEGRCDLEGAELVQRDDDKPETVKTRLYVYYKQTSPLVGYYFAKGLLTEIDGTQPIDEVQAQLLAVVQSEPVA
ncbi:MAG: adenylate kinase [Caldilineaceae bacterium]|nr:adenylate kinase [Caldilineaceae bacterium]